MMNNSPLLPYFLPLAGSLFLLFSRLTESKGTARIALRGAALFTSYGLSGFLIGTSILTEAVSGYVGGYERAFAVRYEITPVTAAVYLLAIFITFVCDLYGGKELREKPQVASVIHIQLAFIGFTLISRDLFNLFVTLEVLGITSYILIASGEKYRASFASLSYLLMSSFAMAFFLLGIYGIYRETGYLDMTLIKTWYAENGTTAVSRLSISSLSVSLLLRSALFPLHTWLPEAHASAPHHVSALLSGLLIKIPLFPLALIVTMIPAGRTLAVILLWTGTLSAILAVITAFSQKDIKRLLAFHSISQMGYVVASFGAFLITGETELLYIAALLHLTFHALFKSTLFLSAGRLIDLTHSRDVYTLRNGARTLMLSSKANGITIAAFFLSALSIAATPATNAFISKQLITDALKEYPAASWTLVAAGAFTVASFIKLSRIFFPDRSEALTGVKKEVKGIASLLLSLLFLIASSIGEHLALSLPFLSTFHPYSLSHLEKTAATLAAGALIYALLRVKPVVQFIHLIRETRVSLTVMLLSVPLFTGIVSFLLHTGQTLF